MFLVSIVMARSVAESGMLVTESSFRPIDLYVMFQSKSTLGKSSRAFLSLFDAILVKDQGGHILTGFMDSLRFADSVGLKRRSLVPVFGVGVFATLVAAASIQLYLPYRYGANYMFGYTYRGNPWNVSNYYASVTSGAANSRYLIPFFVGMAVTAFLAAMRALYWWWPLHPLGYALPASWTMSAFWFPVLIAWLVKSLVMRYGGLKRYLRLRPFFLGMIFGEFSMAVLWVAISWLTKAPTPYFPWN
jgi:hypothetical protein